MEDIEIFVAGAESSLPTVSVPESQQDSDSCQDIRVVRKACRTTGDILDNFSLLYMPDNGNEVCTICVPSPQDETFSAKMMLTVVKVFFLNGR